MSSCFLLPSQFCIRQSHTLDCGWWFCRSPRHTSRSTTVSCLNHRFQNIRCSQRTSCLLLFCTPSSLGNSNEPNSSVPDLCPPLYSCTVPWIGVTRYACFVKVAHLMNCQAATRAGKTDRATTAWNVQLLFLPLTLLQAAPIQPKVTSLFDML